MSTPNIEQIKEMFPDKHPDLWALVEVIREMDADERDMEDMIEALGLDSSAVATAARARASFAEEMMEGTGISREDMVATGYMEGIMVGIQFQRNRQNAS